MKPFIDENGNAHESMSFDGYDIAERVLEGVWIDICFNDKGKLIAQFRADDEDYVSDLNTRSYLSKAVKHAKSAIEEEEYIGFVSTADNIAIASVILPEKPKKAASKSAAPSNGMVINLETTSSLGGILTARSKAPKR